MTLSEIYRFIRERFSYYKNKRGLYNSIRHNLSLNDCFVKLDRTTSSPGRGLLWAMHPDSENMFAHGSFRRRRGKFKSKKSISTLITRPLHQNQATNVQNSPGPVASSVHQNVSSSSQLIHYTSASRLAQLSQFYGGNPLWSSFSIVQPSISSFYHQPSHTDYLGLFQFSTMSSMPLGINFPNRRYGYYQ